MGTNGGEVTLKEKPAGGWHRGDKQRRGDTTGTGGVGVTPWGQPVVTLKKQLGEGGRDGDNRGRGGTVGTTGGEVTLKKQPADRGHVGPGGVGDTVGTTSRGVETVGIKGREVTAWGQLELG